MRAYIRKDGDDFIRNGDSVVRVGLMRRFRDPNHSDRVIKILAVQQVIVDSMVNPIKEGEVLAISFPEEKVNAHAYTWSDKEPFQSKVQVHLLKGPAPQGSVALN